MQKAKRMRIIRKAKERIKQVTNGKILWLITGFRKARVLENSVHLLYKTTYVESDQLELLCEGELEFSMYPKDSDWMEVHFELKKSVVESEEDE